MATTTTNLSLNKPTVGGDTDAWGGYLNTNFDTLDAIFKSDGAGTGVGLNISKAQIAAGTAAAPTLYGASDTNTGIFFPAADTCAVATGGNERVRINSSGNLGIATTDPATKLHVVGTVRVDGNMEANSAQYVYSWAGGTTGQVRSGVYLDGTNNILQLYTGQGERVRVHASGAVSIGNTTDAGAGGLAINGAISEKVYTITDGASFEIDPRNGTVQLITLGANRTPKATNFAAGQYITLMVDDGTAYALTWTDATWGGSGVVWKTDAGVAPTLNTSGYTVIVLWKVSTQVYGARVGNA